MATARAATTTCCKLGSASDRYGGTVSMFRAHKNIFEKFFGIRDQEVKMTRIDRQKSPQQIKKEHMQTTIPMFAQNVRRYKMVKKQHHPAKLETILGLRSPQGADSRIRFDYDTSMDIQRSNPNYQGAYCSTDAQDNSKPAAEAEISAALLRRNRSLSPLGYAPDQQSQTVKGRSLMKQRLEDFLHGPAPGAAKTASGFKLNKSISCGKGLKGATSYGHLNSSSPDGKAALFATLNSSPKWSQIKEKNMRYPHIC